MMTVRLIAHTPEPEKVVAAAAKLCYSDAHITDLLDGLDEEKTAKFLTMLSDLGHASPIEHASFTFGIEGSAALCLPRSPGTASHPSACRASAMCVWMIFAM
jgi:thymidylate synthase ThyX